MTKIENRRVLANNLVALLGLKKKTRRNLADELNISYTKVCDWTRARTYPNNVELGKLSNYFETTIEQLTDGNSVMNEKGFDPEQSTEKKKVSVIDISTDEWVLHPVDYEWVSTKYLMPGKGYIMFNIVDDLMDPKYIIGDTIMAELVESKSLKDEGDYLLKLKDYDQWTFIHIYIKKDGFLIAPLNSNNSKDILPVFLTKEELIKACSQVHKAVRVSKNI